MNDREISDLKLDMLFKIFGISIVDHEEVIFCDHIISGRRIIPSMQKDIEVGILNEKEPWYIRGRYDNYDILREVIRVLEHVDNSETFYISGERWPILTQRCPFVRTLERRANEFLKECRYLPDFNNFKIVEFSNVNECSHDIRIYMENGTLVERSMNGEDLGRGYYSRLVFVLLNMFEEVLEIQEEIDCNRQLEYVKQKREKDEKEEKDRLLIISILNPTYYYDQFGLGKSISFEVLPSITLNPEACATSEFLLNNLRSHVQSKLHLPDIDVRALERNINTEFKRYYNRFESCWIETNGFNGNYILEVRFQGLAFKKSIDSDLLYSWIIYILEELIWKADEMEATAYMKAEFTRIQLNSIYGLGADLDGDALVVMHRGRGYGKSLAQIKAIDELLKNGVSKIQMKIFESLVTGNPNGEAEILIGVNKEDKTMMIPVVRRPEIKEVIFNEPATIVFWKDGTKTVVKCGKGEKFDPEKGVAIALAKKMLYSKDYSRVIASSDDWKKAKEAKKKAAAKKKPMPKLPVNANITKTSTVKKTTRKGAK